MHRNARLLRFREKKKKKCDMSLDAKNGPMKRCKVVPVYLRTGSVDQTFFFRQTPQFDMVCAATLFDRPQETWRSYSFCDLLDREDARAWRDVTNSSKRTTQESRSVSW
jgi:hypothetical protein